MIIKTQNCFISETRIIFFRHQSQTSIIFRSRLNSIYWVCNFRGKAIISVPDNDTLWHVALMFFNLFNKWTNIWNTIKRGVEKTTLCYFEKKGSKLKSCSYSQIHLPSWLSIWCFYGRTDSPSWCLGERMGWLIWNKVKLCRKQLFHITTITAGMVNTDFRLQEGSTLSSSQVFVSGLILWVHMVKKLPRAVCKILQQRLFSFSSCWPFWTIKKVIT